MRDHYLTFADATDRARPRDRYRAHGRDVRCRSRRRVLALRPQRRADLD